MAIADALSGLTAPTMQDVAAPQMSAPQVQLEENKSKWRQFLGTLEDPNVRQAMIATGIGLMRSPQYGQNSGDIIANALGSGVNTLQGLRNMQYERSQKEAQQKQENRRADQTVANQTTSVGYQGQSVAQQGQQITNQNTQATTRNEIDRGALSETQRHNQELEEIARRNAESERIRAKAYGSTAGANQGQDVFKINALTAQYQAEGMDETAARAKAVMVVESTGAAKTPGEQAQKLYEAKLKNWMQDINNFGKSLTPQQMKDMATESMNEVFAFHNFNAGVTGQPPAVNPNKPKAGVIDRSTGSAVGTTKQFGGASPGTYKKIKAGPDSDQSTWQKVTTPNGNTK